MKTLEVSELEFASEFPELDEISGLLDRLNIRIPVDVINWKEFSYRPDVEFSIGYTDNEILLKYYVTERWFRAVNTVSNQEVYEDSCVEFFILPAGDSIYYNFEFNGIGTCLMGSGTSRTNLRRSDPGIISRIRRHSSAGTIPIREVNGDFSWTITIAIPLNVFIHHKISGLKGNTFKANFYKCGDKTKVPHYLSWSPIKSENPDFHLPEFFGNLVFK